MAFFTRRRLLIAVPLVVLILVAVAALFLIYGEDATIWPVLKSRSARISVGMTFDQVEGILGTPAIVLQKRAGGTTEVWQAVATKSAHHVKTACWVDQFWQVNVSFNSDGLVESVGSFPSDSFYRRTVGRLISLP